MRRWCAFAFAAALILAACSGDHDSVQPAQEGPASPSTGEGPLGIATPAREACAPARPHSAGDTDETLTSGGLERTYILHVPPSYDGATRVPLVVNLHGYASNAFQQKIYSGWPAKADEEGFIVVTPDATGSPQRWNTLPAGEPDDVAFIGELIDQIQATLCIDAARVYASGMSNGAAMSAQLACSLPDRIAAIAPVAAFIYPLQCGSRKPMPVIAFHGTDDPLVPYDGGTTRPFNLPVRPVEEYAAEWGRHNGCNPEPAHARVSEHVRTIAYSECNDEVAVVLYIVEGGGHTWPGSAIDLPALLGTTTREISATDLAWEFFEGQAQARP